MVDGPREDALDLEGIAMRVRLLYRLGVRAGRWKSRREMSRKLGLSHSHIGHLMTKRIADPGGLLLRKIAVGCFVTVDWILDGRDPFSALESAREQFQRATADESGDDTDDGDDDDEPGAAGPPPTRKTRRVEGAR